MVKLGSFAPLFTVAVNSWTNVDVPIRHHHFERQYDSSINTDFDRNFRDKALQFLCTVMTVLGHDK